MGIIVLASDHPDAAAGPDRIGLFHAFLINRFGLPPFIATLATMSGLRSLASILSREPGQINVPFDLVPATSAATPPGHTFTDLRRRGRRRSA